MTPDYGDPVLTFGKFRGRSWKEAYEEDPTYFTNFLARATDDGNRILPLVKKLQEKSP
jgi:hypothetical protein